jgi:3-methyladenine DNA glycosylase/8-oxoguanine DNA glycosylase
LDLEALRECELPSAELRSRLRAIRGVGPYAAATLSMILGRYDELAVDSEFRQFVSRAYFGGKPVNDADARAVYEAWGRWKYLAYWFDLTSG